ncbi:MAG: hypothetical protein Q9222_005980, partial [Ikaeria aurantiellina]
MTNKASIYAPPSHPPPFLSALEIHSLATHGFLRLPNLPPILESSHQDLLSHLSEFFKQQASAKEHQFPAAQGTELGYYLVESEKEYLTFRHQQADPSIAHTNQTSQITATTKAELQQASAHFWKFGAKLLHRVLCDLSSALCIPLEAWDSLLDGCLTMPERKKDMTPSLLRLFKYEPHKGGAERHIDTGLLTLCIGTGAGLQVWTPSHDGASPEDGTWDDVGTTPTVLVGKTLQWLSANRVKSGIHRVVPNAQGRQSVVLAMRPSLRHPQLDLAPFGEPQVADLRQMWSQIKG